MSQILLLLFAVTGFLIFARAGSHEPRMKHMQTPAPIAVFDEIPRGSLQVCPNVVVLKLTR